jgi:hypothetical protein
MERPFRPGRAPENRKLQNEEERPPPKWSEFLHEPDAVVVFFVSLFCAAIVAVGSTDEGARIFKALAERNFDEANILLDTVVVSLLATIGFLVLRLIKMVRKHADRNREAAKKLTETVDVGHRNAAEDLRVVSGNVEIIGRELRAIAERARSRDEGVQSLVRDIFMKLSEVHTLAYNSSKAIGGIEAALMHDESAIETLVNDNVELKSAMAEICRGVHDVVERAHAADHRVIAALQDNLGIVTSKLVLLEGNYRDVESHLVLLGRKIDSVLRASKIVISHERAAPRELNEANKLHTGDDTINDQQIIEFKPSVRSDR